MKFTMPDQNLTNLQWYLEGQGQFPAGSPFSSFTSEERMRWLCLTWHVNSLGGSIELLLLPGTLGTKTAGCWLPSPAAD